MASPDTGAADLYRALTLAERAAAPLSGGVFEHDPATGLRLAQWRQLSPFRPAGWLACRLAQDGLDEASFERLLAAPAAAVGARLPGGAPPWLDALAPALAAAAPPPSGPPAAGAEAGFLELVRPLVAAARERLRAGIARLGAPAAAGLPFVPEDAERLLAESLPERLTPALARTLVLELHVARHGGLLAGATPEERFAAFVDRLRRPEAAAALWREYPVLARHVIEELERWVETSLELLARLAADWRALVAVLFDGRAPGPLAALGGGAGDRHRGGRAVRILTFGDGRRLVYKPRPLAVDVHFGQLLAWLAGRGMQPLATPRALDCGDYGWVEHVAAAGCATAAEVALYHRRLGALLAVLYALEATDCHYDNLIAAGGQPVLVDLEALLHPRMEQPEPRLPDEKLAHRALLESVLRVGLLPFRVGESEDFEGVDLSGVAAVEGAPTPHPVLQMEGAGTDDMRVVRRRVPMPGGRNRPSLAGREIDAAEHAGEVAAGFAAAYRLLARERDALLAPDGPLARFAADPVRAVLRPTQLYALLLGESFHPDVLRDALDRDLLLDRLWVEVDERPALARIIAAEHGDLAAGDVPAFAARPDSTDLWTSRGERIPGFFAEPALAAVCRRLRGLGEEDLARQLSLLSLSLGAQRLPGDDAAGRAAAPADPGPPLPPAALRERLLAGARAAGLRLAATAIADGTHATWIELEFRQLRWSLVPAPDDLYLGLPGIALFLGYLGKVAGEPRAAALARAATAAFVARLDGGAGPATIGAFQGWGGIVYALAHLGALWHDGKVLAAAEQSVARLAALVARDEDVDVVGGAAGAVAGLLALHGATGSPRALAAAVVCGERLLALARPQATGLGWLTRMATADPQVGFSHGNAGIGLALIELGATVADARFVEAGLAAFAWERETFWPELRRWLAADTGEAPPPESTVAMAWCYGAPGVGLARLTALARLGCAARRELAAEVDEAVEQTLARGFGQSHCLCHGDLGNLDFLLQVARRRGDAGLERAVARLAQQVLAGIERDGWRCGTRGGLESPGLMHGLAGIGYGLLRLAAPDRVPSVLALAPPLKP
jgi:class II lanthipeptide synthase